MRPLLLLVSTGSPPTRSDKLNSKLDLCQGLVLAGDLTPYPQSPGPSGVRMSCISGCLQEPLFVERYSKPLAYGQDDAWQISK